MLKLLQEMDESERQLWKWYSAVMLRKACAAKLIHHQVAAEKAGKKLLNAQQQLDACTNVLAMFAKGSETSDLFKITKGRNDELSVAVDIAKQQLTKRHRALQMANRSMALFHNSMVEGMVKLSLPMP